MNKFSLILRKFSSIPWVIIFFTAYLFLGMATFDDYGVSWDEMFQNDKAILNLDYITGQNSDLLTYPDRHYSAILAIPFYLIGDSFNDSRTDYLFRHFSTFFIFYSSAICFYLISRKLSIRSGIALLGTSMYVFHPHIFSHSFYNVKDIPFLALYLVSIYTLILFVENRKIYNAVVHGMISGLLVVFRLPGLMMWMITFIAWVVLFKVKWEDRQKIFWLGVTFLVSCLIGLYAFMPSLWANPVKEISDFFSMDLFTWSGKELFMGNFLISDMLPYYYLPVYFIVTTPILYSVLFLVGTIIVVFKLFSLKKTFEIESISLLGIFLSFFLPGLYIILSRPIMYNGWRHAFFIYAPFSIIAMLGANKLYTMIQASRYSSLRRAFNVTFFAAITIQAVLLLIFMVRAHPYEHVYYNFFAGENLNVARTRFSMDYWGLAYRGGLEVILRDDKRLGPIRVSGLERNLVEENWKILPKNLRDRIIVVGPKKDADYFLSHQTYKSDASNQERVLWKSIDVLGASIHRIYKYK